MLPYRISNSQRIGRLIPQRGFYPLCRLNSEPQHFGGAWQIALRDREIGPFDGKQKLARVGLLQGTARRAEFVAQPHTVVRCFPQANLLPQQAEFIRRDAGVLAAKHAPANGVELRQRREIAARLIGSRPPVPGVGTGAADAGRRQHGLLKSIQIPPKALALRHSSAIALVSAPGPGHSDP